MVTEAVPRRTIPRLSGFDHTLSLKRDPYHFISKHCQRLGSDLFETRLMLQRAICMTGEEAAALLYDESKFSRKGAAPFRAQATLFGKKTVHGLDGAEHRQRKAMFLSIIDGKGVASLNRAFEEWFRVYLSRWEKAGRVVLYNDVREIITRAVCQWAGVPLPEEDVKKRTLQMAALYENAASVGPSHWWGRICRHRVNAWVRELVEQVRRGELAPPRESALHVASFYLAYDGTLLTSEVAGVELINVLRPTVAVSPWIALVAHALHHHPQSCEFAGDARFRNSFSEEVRRCYPFFPAIPAVVRNDFEWKGYHFPKGTRALLDVYGTNHDPRIWDNPDQFDPHRFEDRQVGEFEFIPQGGGNRATGHRCPGDPISVALMSATLKILCTEMKYDVPKQDLTIDEQHLPALPRDRFLIENVRSVQSS